MGPNVAIGILTGIYGHLAPEQSTHSTRAIIQKAPELTFEKHQSSPFLHQSSHFLQQSSHFSNIK